MQRLSFFKIFLLFVTCRNSKIIDFNENKIVDDNDNDDASAAHSTNRCQSEN